jgi:hypothetical protein
MQRQAFRTVILAAIWLAAIWPGAIWPGAIWLGAIWAPVGGALATGAFANAAAPTPAPAELRTSSLQPMSTSNPLPRAASYRPDARDTGPPTPGPTDPNGPPS